VIQRELQNPIALAVLEGRFGEGDTIRVSLDGDQLRFATAAPAEPIPEPELAGA
nr:hypothetical protein [Gemmatimonadales bacterium]